ncbi:MAG: M4 family metallopeptidase, partial [Panacibacter sp.]
RTLVTYLTPVSEYRDARRYAVKSAEDLYGIGSEEALQTAKAWDAVGVDETTNEKENNLTKHNNIVQ